MHYADAVELVAEIVALKHACGPDCLCWRLRTVPEVKAALENMRVKDSGAKELGFALGL